VQNIFNDFAGSVTLLYPGGQFDQVNTGATWVRRSSTFTLASQTTGIFGPQVSTGLSASGNFFGFQIEPGTVASTYSPTDATALLGARFDYNPVTLAARGLLIEEQRANLLLRSSDWTTTWSNTNITLGAPVLAPDGTVTATRLQATASAATSCLQSVIATATSHIYSIYAKQGSGVADANQFILRNSTTATNLAVLTIDYSTGVVTQTVGTGATASNSGNGWWRIQIPATSGITIGNTLFVYACFAGSVETAGEYAYVWGAQLEAGAFATSYIPTVASQVTRAADSVSIDTLTPWYNATEGSLFVQFSCPGYDAAVFPPIAVLGTTSVSNRGYSHVINGSTNDSGFNIYDDTPTYQGVPGFAAYTKGATRKQIGAYKVNNSAATSDGAAATTDTSVTLPTSLNTLTIGRYAIAGTARLNGHIQNISYYPTRLLNASLQALTV